MEETMAGTAGEIDRMTGVKSEVAGGMAKHEEDEVVVNQEIEGGGGVLSIPTTDETHPLVLQFLQPLMELRRHRGAIKGICTLLVVGGMLTQARATISLQGVCGYSYSSFSF